MNRRQAFVVGGYSPGSPFDAILVGYYEGDKLPFAGRVRAGFTPASKGVLYELLKGLRIETCPFANLPSRKSDGWNEGVTAEEAAEMIWVRPKVVVQIEFVEWTDYGPLRIPSTSGSGTTRIRSR